MSNTVQRVRTCELGKHVGEVVELAGWIQAKRELGKLVFTVVRDGWGTAQVVSGDGTNPPSVPCESAIRVKGKVVAEANAAAGVELHSLEWQLVSVSETTPISMGKKTLKVNPSMLLDYASLSLRHPSRRFVFEASARIAQRFRKVLNRMGFTEIMTPKINGGAAEGGANVFRLDYFGKTAFLAQSPQLYKQMMVGVFERVYEVGPVFRAEPHDTSRHLNQYTSLDAEMGFIRDHRDIMRVVESVVVEMVNAGIEGFMEQGGNGQPHTNRPQPPVISFPIPSISFWEAEELLHREFGRKTQGQDDLSPQDERDLGQWCRETCGSDFLFVTGYPMKTRPFYTHPDPTHPGYSNSFDLLFRGLEIVTGGQRLHRYGDYTAALEERGMATEPFESYLNTFRYGMPPHGGFAIGLERFVAQLLGIDNVREAALFPRTMNRLQP